MQLQKSNLLEDVGYKGLEPLAKGFVGDFFDLFFIDRRFEMSDAMLQHIQISGQKNLFDTYLRKDGSRIVFYIKAYNDAVRKMTMDPILLQLKQKREGIACENHGWVPFFEFVTEHNPLRPPRNLSHRFPDSNVAFSDLVSFEKTSVRPYNERITIDAYIE